MPSVTRSQPVVEQPPGQRGGDRPAEPWPRAAGSHGDRRQVADAGRARWCRRRRRPAAPSRPGMPTQRRTRASPGCADAFGTRRREQRARARVVGHRHDALLARLLPAAAAASQRKSQSVPSMPDPGRQVGAACRAAAVTRWRGGSSGSSSVDQRRRRPRGRRARDRYGVRSSGVDAEPGDGAARRPSRARAGGAASRGRRGRGRSRRAPRRPSRGGSAATPPG